MPHTNGGTRFTKKRQGRQASSLADAPASVLAQLPKETPVVLLPQFLPKYPPGDPRNASVKAARAAATAHAEGGTVLVQSDPAIGRGMALANARAKDATVEAGEPRIVLDGVTLPKAVDVEFAEDQTKKPKKAKRAR